MDERGQSAAAGLLREIEAWCDRTGTTEQLLGAALFNHPGFVALLRKRLTASSEKAIAVRQYLANHPRGVPRAEAARIAAYRAAARENRGSRRRTTAEVCAMIPTGSDQLGASVGYFLLPDVMEREAERLAGTAWPPAKREAADA